MENSTSCSSSTCPVLDGQKDNPENMDIYQHVEENEGEIEKENEAHSLEMPNPLEMLDIVNLLLKKLDSRTLKSSLLVSKLWNEEGMKLFVKNHCIRVPTKLALKTKEEENEMIEEFAKLLSKFTLIPNVAINKSRDIQILKDFKVLEQVKYVKINTTTEEYDANVLKIMDECPNLSFLEVESNPFIWSALVQKIVETGKDGTFTISHLWIRLLLPSDCELLEKFANAGIKVVCLHFEKNAANLIEHLHISSILEKVLHSSKDCLEKIELGMQRSILSIKNIPVMPQLNYLSIRLWTHAPVPASEFATIFPPAFKFAEHCPNLKTCSFKFVFSSDIEVPAGGENYLDMLFATTGPAQSVKSLTFDSPCEPMKLDKLFQTFNGIENFSMGSYASGTNLIPLWELCQNLKSLKMALYLGHDNSCQLLAQLTGYPLDFITGLWNSSTDLKNVKLPPRARSSIVNLQGLESSNIGNMFENEEIFRKWNKLIHELALRHIPKMKKRQTTA